eukprot:6670886-Pyramimonas_sp.AAC.1
MTGNVGQRPTSSAPPYGATHQFVRLLAAPPPKCALAGHGAVRRAIPSSEAFATSGHVTRWHTSRTFSRRAALGK